MSNDKEYESAQYNQQDEEYQEYMAMKSREEMNADVAYDEDLYFYTSMEKTHEDGENS